MKVGEINFSIITPSYRRPEFLSRALDSVLDQDHQYWEMIVINDSPGYEGYTDLRQKYLDPRIKFFDNNENLGANASRNTGLSNVSAGSDWVIFLDDDDWLAPEGLSGLTKLIEEHPEEKWLLTNRASDSDNSKTSAPQNLSRYHYARDYLIGKRIIGDATHCIFAMEAVGHRFPFSIKNGEEWLYFFSLGRRLQPFYVDTNTTLTQGYAEEGLNFRKRDRQEQFNTLAKIFREARLRNFVLNPYFLLYLGMRGIRACIK